MRLFAAPSRIPCRMSATFTTTIPAPARSILLFSAHMADDNKALAHGLKRRDPDLVETAVERGVRAAVNGVWGTEIVKGTVKGSTVSLSLTDTGGRDTGTLTGKIVIQPGT